MRRAFLVRAVWAGALTSLAVTFVGCFWHDARRAHEEMLLLRSSIQSGMTPGEIEAVFRDLQPQHLRYAGASRSVVTVVQAAPESGLKEWVLWVSLREGRAAALRIRTADSHEERPHDAPEDIIWQAEDPDTPFSRQVQR